MTHKRGRATDAWLNGSMFVAVLSSAVFDDDLAYIAGALIATLMLEVWLVKSGVRTFFCRLFLLVPVLILAAGLLLLWRRF